MRSNTIYIITIGKKRARARVCVCCLYSSHACTRSSHYTHTVEDYKEIFGARPLRIFRASVYVCMCTRSSSRLRVVQYSVSSLYHPLPLYLSLSLRFLGEPVISRLSRFIPSIFVQSYRRCINYLFCVYYCFIFFLSRHVRLLFFFFVSRS